MSSGAMANSPSSSLWKLSGMMLGIIVFAMLLMWVFTTWPLRKSFDEVGRAVIEDDLGEYSVIYEQGGIRSVDQLFHAGGHDSHDQALRLISSSGETLLDVLIPNHPEVQWPELPKWQSPKDSPTNWSRHPLADGTILTIGRRKLADGAELWFGRSNTADLIAISQVHNYLLVAMGAAAALAIVPVLWFGSRVLRPVRILIAGAHRLVSGQTFDHRLKASASIPELQEFAAAFNESLDRVQILTEELEAANDQLAHELRTPLARIRGNVEHILKQPAIDDTVREDAARAIDEIKRSTALIQSILSVRAGDSGVLKLDLKPLSLVRLVEESCELYSAMAEEKELQFTVVLPDRDEAVLLDQQKAQQALCNLLDNAIAYTPRGGAIEVGLVFERESAVVKVRDSGPGLSDSDLEQIWMRFKRGSASSASTPGIGLGLSLVKAVAKAHRGEAGAVTLEEGGSEFWLRFPLAESGTTSR